MSSKLTLSVDEDAIETGKRVAAEVGKSLSSMVQDYLMLLGKTRDGSGLYPISPGLQNLVGIGAGPFDETDYRARRIARQS